MTGNQPLVTMIIILLSTTRQRNPQSNRETRPNLGNTDVRDYRSRGRDGKLCRRKGRVSRPFCRLGTIARRYNYSMARGWESKSVEAQIEESDSEPSLNANRSSSAEDIQLQMKKSDLELSRKQVLQQLERSDSERYSELLRRTLAGLDAQIAALD